MRSSGKPARSRSSSASTSSSRSPSPVGSRPGCAEARPAPGPRGSGSSRSRRSGTPASAGGRGRRSSAGVGAPPRRAGSGSSCSLREEDEAVLADLELVAVLELRRLDALPVQEGAVQAALVLDEEGAVALDEHRVAPGDGDVVEEDPTVGRASDRRALALGSERLALAAAAGADDERRPLHAHLLEGDRTLLGQLVRRERHGRVRSARVADEQRAAARAVVRGLRILEPALGAVDVAHSPSVGTGGAAFCDRIAVSLSTSTSSSGLRPSPTCCWRRAVRSARRMSIFPWSMRRRYETSCSSSISLSIKSFSSASVRELSSGRASTNRLSSRTGPTQ